MRNFFLENIDYTPRRVFLLLALFVAALLAYGAYLQYGVGLEPCPMCIVQRYAMVLMALLCLGAAALKARRGHIGLAWAVALVSVGGAFVAARQSWLQWHPPAIASCGRDFYGMVEDFPLSRALPMIFRGSGDCSQVDWRFLGGSIANWSFLCFCAVFVLATLIAVRHIRRGAVL